MGNHDVRLLGIRLSMISGSPKRHTIFDMLLESHRHRMGAIGVQFFGAAGIPFFKYPEYLLDSRRHHAVTVGVSFFSAPGVSFFQIPVVPFWWCLSVPSWW